MHASDLWQAMANGDAAARDRLVNENLGLIHHAARRLHAGMPADCDYQDLVSAGAIGLLAAVDSFDTARGLSFSTFAMPRIRGAMLDELRRQDTVSRSTRRRQRDVVRARQQLAGTLGHEPTGQQVAEALGVDARTVSRWEADAQNGTLLSLDRKAPAASEESHALRESVIASDEPSIEDVLTHEVELEAMRDALRTLTQQERTVIGLYFHEELKLHQIATILRLTESRVSQIRTKALAKLRGRIGGLRAAVG